MLIDKNSTILRFDDLFCLVFLFCFFLILNVDINNNKQ